MPYKIQRRDIAVKSQSFFDEKDEGHIKKFEESKLDDSWHDTRYSTYDSADNARITADSLTPKSLPIYGPCRHLALPLIIGFNIAEYRVVDADTGEPV